MDSPGPWLYVALIGLLLLSAFFSASETAISTVNRIRLRKLAEDGDERAVVALGIVENYDKALFTLLIGNNFVNIASSSIATVLATGLFGSNGALVSTLVMTLLVLIFGEILPKSYAGDYSGQVTLSVAKPLRLVIIALTPLTAIFQALKGKVSPVREEHGPSVTEEELAYIVDAIEEEGVLEEQEGELVRSALKFDEIAVQEVLTPRVDVVALDAESTTEEIVAVILEEGYARIPVFEDTVDDIIGVLYTRDFLQCVLENRPAVLKELITKPLFVPRTIRLSRLLTAMKAEKVNLAVVTDDYGGTLGIVTMEDLLEQLVGEIWDEGDEIPFEFLQIDESRYEVGGDYSLRKMLEQLELDDENAGDYITVSGWATHMLSHIALVDESFACGEYTMTVLEMDGHRIKRLGIQRTPLAGPSSPPQADA